MSSAESPGPFGQGHYVKPRDNPTQDSFNEASLNAMIESASHSQLSYLLQNLCSRSKTAAKLTNAHLLPLQKKPDPPKPTPPRSILKKTKPPKHSPRPEPQPVANPPPSSPDDPRPTTDTSTPIDTHAPPKRKATFHCRNCGRDYTLAESADDTCTHHPGKREVNEAHEVWDEFDPDYLGDAWTLMEYERFAGGFRWSCCQRGVMESGCRVGIHEAAPGEWKKVKG